MGEWRYRSWDRSVEDLRTGFKRSSPGIVQVIQFVRVPHSRPRRPAADPGILQHRPWTDLRAPVSALRVVGLSGVFLRKRSGILRLWRDYDRLCCLAQTRVLSAART